MKRINDLRNVKNLGEKDAIAATQHSFSSLNIQTKPHLSRHSGLGFSGSAGLGIVNWQENEPRVFPTQFDWAGNFLGATLRLLK